MAITIFTEVTLPAGSYDLTDLPTTKDELAIKAADTGNDIFLKRAITQASSAIASYCSQIFQVETLVDTFDRQGRPDTVRQFYGPATLQLSRSPVVSVASLTENGTALVEGTDFRVDKKLGLVYRLSADSTKTVPWSLFPVVVTYSAGFTKFTTKSASVPGTGPFTITVDNATTFVLDKGVQYANGTPLVAVAGVPAVGQYAVVAGVYTFNAADANAAVVIFYVYAAVPDDVISAALRLITMRFKAKGRDPMLMQHSEPNIGEDRWWVGGAPKSAHFTPEIDNLLAPYRRIPVAA